MLFTSPKLPLAYLIPRLYDATDGEVLIASHNVKDYSVRALRDDIGVVLQQNLLFTGTIRSNIQWGKKNATDEEIWEALDIASAKSFVEDFKGEVNTDENIQVGGFEAAFRGLRNPMNSWDKSDSRFGISSSLYNDDDYDVTATYINPDFIEHSQEWEEEFEAINNWLLENGILKRDIETDAIEYAFIGKKDIDLARRMILAGTDEAKFMRMIHIQMDVTAPLYW